jgi:hypothetical protein
VPRQVGALGQRLRTQHLVDRAQAHAGGRLRAQPPRAFERKHVGRIGDDLGAARRRQRAILRRGREARAGSQWRHRRELQRVELRCSGERETVDAMNRALVEHERGHEGVTAELRE